MLLADIQSRYERDMAKYCCAAISDVWLEY